MFAARNHPPTNRAIDGCMYLLPKLAMYLTARASFQLISFGSLLTSIFAGILVYSPFLLLRFQSVETLP